MTAWSPSWSCPRARSSATSRTRTWPGRRRYSATASVSWATSLRPCCSAAPPPRWRTTVRTSSGTAVKAGASSSPTAAPSTRRSRPTSTRWWTPSRSTAGTSLMRRGGRDGRRRGTGEDGLTEASARAGPRSGLSSTSFGPGAVLVQLDTARGLAPAEGAALARHRVHHEAIDLAALVVGRQVLGDGQAVLVHEQQAVAVLVLLHFLAGADPDAGRPDFLRLVRVEVAGAERPAELVDVLGEADGEELGDLGMGVQKAAALLGELLRIAAHPGGVRGRRLLAVFVGWLIRRHLSCSSPDRASMSYRPAQ